MTCSHSRPCEFGQHVCSQMSVICTVNTSAGSLPSAACPQLWQRSGAKLRRPPLHTQAAEAAEDVHRLVGAALGQLKALKGGAAAVAGAASPLAGVLDTCLQPLAAAGGYAQVQTFVQHAWHTLTLCKVWHS